MVPTLKQERMESLSHTEIIPLTFLDYQGKISEWLQTCLMSLVSVLVLFINLRKFKLLSLYLCSR